MREKQKVTLSYRQDRNPVIGGVQMPHEDSNMQGYVAKMALYAAKMAL